MTHPARQAKLTSIQALCLGALCLLAHPAAAQSGDVDLFPVTPESPPTPAPAPLGAPAEHPPTDLFVPPAPAAPAPTPHRQLQAPDARWEMSGGLSGSLYSYRYGPDSAPIGDVHGNRGGIYLAPTVYLTPVVDSAAPRSLQPFLQRTSTIYASVSGGGFLTHYGDGAFTRKDSYVGASVGADVYVTRHLALTGELGYTYDALHDGSGVNKGHSFSATPGIGVRLGDVRIDATYGFDAYDVDGAFQKLRWGAVALSAYFLLAESFALTLGGHVTDGGGGGRIDLGFYTSKDVGVFAGFAGTTFVYSTTGVRTNNYAGSLGLSYWITPGLRVNPTYVLSRNSSPAEPPRALSSDEIEHALSLDLLARLP
jgi:hypothetical protein